MRLKYLNIVLIIITIIISGCVSAPRRCGMNYYFEYANTSISVSNNSHALEVMKSYMGNANVPYYNDIKDSLPEDLEYREINVIYSGKSKEIKTLAWVLKNSSFAVDNSGIISRYWLCI